MEQSIVRRVVDSHVAAVPAPPVAAIQPRPIVPRVNIHVRAATLADVAFIDAQQKAQSKALGFLPTAALEGKVARGEVLVAESLPISDCRLPNEQTSQSEIGKRQAAIGYLIASDRYFKRDEIGYITQISVIPEYRRSLVAASLLQAQFDRSAYGCRLYCCWCAQDLESANEFWEAMGFTAIAFRTGSRKGRHGGTKAHRHEGEDGTPESPAVPSCLSASVPSARIHIFWQKRVRAGDAGDVKNGGTPWWYPAQTGGGELREDRLVFPIPPGVSWRDVLPVALPGEQKSAVTSQRSANRPRLKKVLKAPPGRKGALWFKHEAIVERVEPTQEELALARRTIDPRLKKMARELRDRWTEGVAGSGSRGQIVATEAKHDVRRMIGADESAALANPIRAMLPKAA